MPTYEIKSPDGNTWEVSAPDGATPDQVLKFAQDQWNATQKPSKGLVDRAGGAVRDLAAGAVRGAGSIGATILAPVDAAARALGVQNDFIGRTDRREAMDSGLREMGADTDSAAFTAGKIGAEIAGTAGAGGALAQGARFAAPAITNLPRVANVLRAVETSGAVGGGLLSRSVGGALTGGASAAMIDPSEVGAGAAIGGAAPSVLGVAGKLGSHMANYVRPSTQSNALAQKAVGQYNIPLGAADVSRSTGTKALRSVLNDVPIIGKIGEAQREAVQVAYNKAVGSTFGASAPKLTPQVMDNAKQRLGAEFDRIWNNNAITVDPVLMQKIGDLQVVAGKLPRNEGGSLAAELQDLMQKMVPDAQGNLTVPGDVANRFQSYLRRRADSSPGLKNELGDLRHAVIGAFNRSVSPADAAALTANRAAYKAYKTVEPIINSAEAGVAGRVAGDVPAALLPGAVLKSYGNAAGTPLGDLSQIGSQFIADRVSRTGGSARAMIQNSFLGGALGAGALSNPLLAAGVIPVAAGTEWLLGNPSFARAAMRLPSNALSAPASLTYRALPVLAADQ